jgi:hypothetical protein
MQPTDLLGTWRLERSVRDRRAAATGTVVGTTTLTREDDDLVRWEESGEMTFGGRTVPVSRVLLVRRDRTGGGDADGLWTVHFADGRVFHPWVWGVAVEHACTPDDYTGVLAGDGVRWTVRWDAVGPTKDYRLDSVLTR